MFDEEVKGAVSFQWGEGQGSDLRNHVFTELALYTGALACLGLLVPMKENCNATAYKDIHNCLFRTFWQYFCIQFIRITFFYNGFRSIAEPLILAVDQHQLYSFKVNVEAVHMDHSSTTASGIQVMMTANQKQDTRKDLVDRAEHSSTTLTAHLLSGISTLLSLMSFEQSGAIN